MRSVGGDSYEQAKVVTQSQEMIGVVRHELRQQALNRSPRALQALGDLAAALHQVVTIIDDEDFQAFHERG